MFRNYLFIALRNITRHKLHSFINIAGLTAGLTAAILIGLFVQQELSFDTWLPGSERIYRISLLVNIPGQPERDGGAASAPLGPAALQEVPNIQEQARIHNQSVAIAVSDKHYSEWINTVDSNFFTMIRLPFVAGNPATALAPPGWCRTKPGRGDPVFRHGSGVGQDVAVRSNDSTRGDRHPARSSLQHAISWRRVRALSPPASEDCRHNYKPGSRPVAHNGCFQLRPPGAGC